MLTHEAIVLLEAQQLTDVFNAAGGQFVVVFTHIICGLRKHQVSALSTGGAQVAAISAFIVLLQK